MNTLAKISSFVNRYNNAFTLLLVYLVYEIGVSVVHAIITLVLVNSTDISANSIFKGTMMLIGLLAASIGPIFLGVFLKKDHKIWLYPLFNIALVFISILGMAMYFHILFLQQSEKFLALEMHYRLPLSVMFILAPCIVLKLLVFNVIYFSRKGQKR